MTDNLYGQQVAKVLGGLAHQIRQWPLPASPKDTRDLMDQFARYIQGLAETAQTPPRNERELAQNPWTIVMDGELCWFGERMTEEGGLVELDS